MKKLVYFLAFILISSACEKNNDDLNDDNNKVTKSPLSENVLA